MRKYLFIKIMCAMLAAVFCLGCFVACGDEGKGSANSESVGGAENTDAPVSLSGWNIGGGKATFKVIHPNNPSEEVEDAVNIIIDAIHTKTGVSPEKGTDYKKRGQEYNDSTYEIFVGRTKHEQTQSILDELEDGQFAIRTVGNKIVITAPKDVNIVAAVNYFVSEFVNTMTESGGAYSLSVTDHTSGIIEDEKGVTVNGSVISDYKIVYETERDGYKDVALRLKSRLEELGYKVSAVRDDVIAETDGAKEILIGRTNRQVSDSIYQKEAPKLMTYKLVVEGGYIQVVSGGPYSASECVDTMVLRFLGVESAEYGDGEYFATDINLAPVALTAGSDVRVMTANILADRWAYAAGDATPPVIQRAEIFAATLISSQPDVIGVQEADADWISILPEYLQYIKETVGIEYRWIFNDYLGKQTLTSIIYRSDKYEEVTSGIENVGYWTNNDYNMRLFEWIYLREKSNPNHKFIMSNTHWGWEDDEKINACVNFSIDKVNGLKSDYPGVPIFHTGDFNSSHREGSSKYIDEYLVKTGFSDAMLVALDKGVRKNELSGCGSVGALRTGVGSYIDHISYYGMNADVLYYETLAAKNIFMTDHLPHIADFKLW